MGTAHRTESIVDCEAEPARPGPVYMAFWDERRLLLRGVGSRLQTRTGDLTGGPPSALGNLVIVSAGAPPSSKGKRKIPPEETSDDDDFEQAN